MLIAIEGIDQSGKATLARRLKAKLEKNGRKTRILSFPDYATPTGQLIRRMLNDDVMPDAASMQLLNAANRNEHRMVLENAVRGEEILICDRYTGSGTAYGKAQGLPEPWLEEIDDRVPTADCTLLVNTHPADSRQRKTKNRDLYERDTDLIRRVGEQYSMLAEQHGWIVIDGAQDPDEVAETAWTVLRTLVDEWYR